MCVGTLGITITDMCTKFVWLKGWVHVACTNEHTRFYICDNCNTDNDIKYDKSCLMLIFNSLFFISVGII